MYQDSGVAWLNSLMTSDGSAADMAVVAFDPVLTTKDIRTGEPVHVSFPIDKGVVGSIDIDDDIIADSSYPSGGVTLMLDREKEYDVTVIDRNTGNAVMRRLKGKQIAECMK